jgi:transcriptional regulator with XRE-family HTH domain
MAKVSIMPRPALRAAAGKPSTETSESHVGLYLRMIRMARGLRLKTVAEAAGCSEGLLSKIENGKADPSLRLLQRVCEFHQMTMGDLLSWAERREAIVSRAADRTLVKFEHAGTPGIQIQRLAPSGHLLAGFINRLEPGGSSGELLTHPGEEMGYVLAGSVDLIVREATHHLGVGDAFSFRSDLPHGYRNPGRQPAEVLIINSPPTF